MLTYSRWWPMTHDDTSTHILLFLYCNTSILYSLISVVMVLLNMKKFSRELTITMSPNVHLIIQEWRMGVLAMMEVEEVLWGSMVVKSGWRRDQVSDDQAWRRGVLAMDDQAWRRRVHTTMVAEEKGDMAMRTIQVCCVSNIWWVMLVYVSHITSNLTLTHQSSFCILIFPGTQHQATHYHPHYDDGYDGGGGGPYGYRNNPGTICPSIHFACISYLSNLSFRSFVF